ncbi:MAG: hypothetical protein N3G22_00665 [Candidatus Micrarchaeota archaeon]|nr:hypothetical protein [Candidatus Micrarchaeota archaeon]
MLLALFTLAFSFEIKQSREEMLDYYFSHIEDKIPSSAKMLIGNEKMNVYVGGKVIGVEVKNGRLYSFEMHPVEKPNVIIHVSDEAAEKISNGESGIMQEIDRGGIRLEAKNLLSAIKIEMIKRIYAISGADEKIKKENKKLASAPLTADSLYFVKKAKIGR